MVGFCANGFPENFLRAAGLSSPRIEVRYVGYHLWYSMQKALDYLARSFVNIDPPLFMYFSNLLVYMTYIYKVNIFRL